MAKFLYEKGREIKDGLSKWWDDQETADDYYSSYSQGDLFEEYDYEEASSKRGAASDWWRGYFNRRSPSQFYGGYGGYIDDGGEVQEPPEQTRLKQELQQIARTVNAVRNTRGALKRERNLKVAWSGSGQARMNIANNMRSTSTIYLSPDPLTDSSTIKQDWSDSQKRDALIGEALSLTAMKRLVQPTAVKQIMSNKVPGETLKDLPLLERSESEKAIMLTIARELWKSLETYTAQQDLLSDYRGCRAYFAAYLAFYSDPGYKKVLIDTMAEPEKINSIRAAAVLAWNINHFNSTSEQVNPPPGDVEEIMIEAFGILMEGLNMRSTTQRWEKAVEAAEIIRDLDPEPDDQKEDWVDQAGQDGDGMLVDASGKNGNTENMFGDQVQNLSNMKGEIDCDDLEPDGVPGGLSQYSEYTKHVTVLDRNLHEGTNEGRYQNLGEDEIKARVETIRDECAPILRQFKKAVEPYAHLPILPEYGMRSGRLSRSSLWKVTTNLPDNDRVFHRKVTQGVSHKVTIGLMLDYSGSTHGGVLECEQRVAMIMHDLFEPFNQVELRLYGHEDRHGGNRVYDFESVKGVCAYNSSGGTNEGTALARAAQCLHNDSSRRSRKILFALGDGCSDPTSIKTSVKAIRSTGMEVYDILITRGDHVKDQAVDCYGEGRVVILDPWSEMEGSLYDKDSIQGVLLNQLTRVLKPWLISMFAKLNNLGSL